ncbi:MAG TPA: pyruvate ferredoxin oxidoreductase [Candidatus Hydrothermia bacterium]|nr:pyruvate ferredoxin oxidoreductase [Candidatus Hydrothermae bacterium]MDD3649304.1 pyruvate ferredoxin oxidoreductase [Candidatus Hydrothermia bacterium]MDD5572622.1 pyruvate ferredoxin oxidoreductase [Candidatus Hydrothermia bacterium]HOK22719.1 pyruvate ferredoxin oxidoreductase [Candidatus Hydrothermia bacterium]HOL23428.1 pyruvate ferredoxin oxidoreductase [Candidatus Hydrothermia bacterium]
MSVKKVLTGNHAVSYGAMVSRVQVISAYPITPQTQVVELLSEMVADGLLKAIFVNVESEHSAMSACVSASAAGARAFTATSAQGLALMHEMLHWAAGDRLPIVLADINRAMAPPWTIWTDQNDSLSQRDTGWMQVYVESNQEAFDSIILAYKVAEQIYLPCMVVLDAFVLSHTSEPIEIYDQEKIDEFLPPYKPMVTIEPGKPIGYGALAGPDTYMEFRYKMQKAMEKAVSVFEKEGKLFGEMFGRTYDLVEPYMLDDAEYVIVTVGAVTSTARVAIQELRKKGEKVGLLKLRVVRPFPFEKLRNILKGKKKVAIIDRNISFGHHGIFYEEIKSALYPLQDRPIVYGYIAGLGGRDVTVGDIIGIYEDMKKRETLDEAIWRGVKL